MMKKILLLPFLIVLLSCSTKRSSEEGLSDSTSTVFVTDSASTASAGKWPDLDIAQYLVYEQGDTTIVFPDLISNHPIENESKQLKQDSRVKRISEGLQFNLKNGKTKIRRENKETDGDDYEDIRSSLQ